MAIDCDHNRTESLVADNKFDLLKETLVTWRETVGEGTPCRTYLHVPGAIPLLHTAHRSHLDWKTESAVIDALLRSRYEQVNTPDVKVFACSCVCWVLINCAVGALPDTVAFGSRRWRGGVGPAAVGPRS